MKPRIPKNLPQPIRRERAGMSRDHLDLVRQLPCLISGRLPAGHAHHLLRTGEHGMGRKSSDRWAVPLAPDQHDALHRQGDEDAFFARHGIDARAVARELWSNTGNLPAMRRIIDRARQAAWLKARAA